MGEEINNAFEETLGYLYEQLPIFQRQGGAAIKMGLENTVALLDSLANPHKRFKSIHVGGTNGKGTTSHAIASILQEEGYKVGLYTSPHLIDFTERIRVNGSQIPKNWVIQFVERIKPDIESINPSFFEVTVAMAFAYFAEEEVDFAIVEVGMGGRLDATNIIDPELSIITNIGWDHQQYLGDTLSKIATEKAGIIKPNKPIVTSEVRPELREIFKAKASEQGSTYYYANDIYVVEETKNGLNIYYRGHLFVEKTKTDVKGKYFLKNLPGVMTAIQLIDEQFAVSSESIKNGLEKVVSNTGLLGRWQLLSKAPNIICDVGHNADGLKAITEQIASEAFDKLYFVIGTVSDKEISDVIKELPKYATYLVGEPDIPRARKSEELTNLLNDAGLEAYNLGKVADALREAQQRATIMDLIFVGGSTFVVAEALEFWRENETKAKKV